MSVKIISVFTYYVKILNFWISNENDGYFSRKDPYTVLRV